LVSEIHYSYDVKGRVTFMNEILGTGQLYGTRYTYDDGGNVKSINTDVDGVTNTYNYNRLNQMEEVTVNGETTNYVYEDSGVIESIEFPNNVFTNYNYDCNKRDWICQISLLKFAGGPPTTIFNEVYRYDVVGNLKNMTDEKAIPNTKVTFEYDDLYRLKSIDNTQGYYNEDGVLDLNSISYDYDAVGNRLNRDVSGSNTADIVKTTGYEYGTDNMLDSTGDCSYDYDAVGNMDRKVCGTEISTYTYDANNMITRIVINDRSKRNGFGFKYDALGRRIYKSHHNQKVSGDYTAHKVTKTWYSYGLSNSPLIDNVEHNEYITTSIIFEEQLIE